MDRLEPFIERLTEEWKQHSKIIVAVDYDDTICNWKMYNTTLYDEVIRLVKLAKETGAYVVINSACDPSRFDEIREFCGFKGILIDAINETPIDVPYGKNRKIYANVYIDDRAGIYEALDILEKSMYRYRGYKQTQSFTGEIA